MKQFITILMVTVLLLFIVAPAMAMPPKGEVTSIIVQSGAVQTIDDHGWGGEGPIQKTPTPLNGWHTFWSWFTHMMYFVAINPL